MSGEADLAGGANISKQSDFVLFSNVGSENGTLTVYKVTEGNLIATTACINGQVNKFLAKSKQEYAARSHIARKRLIKIAKSIILG